MLLAIRVLALIGKFYFNENFNKRAKTSIICWNCILSKSNKFNLLTNFSNSALVSNFESEISNKKNMKYLVKCSKYGATLCPASIEGLQKKTRLLYS